MTERGIVAPALIATLIILSAAVGLGALAQKHPAGAPAGGPSDAPTLERA